MGTQVCNGAQLLCSFGTAPATMVVLPTNQTMTSSVPAATIMDYTPMVNIMSFVMCTSMSNPAVAAATSAAMGVLTPQACVPVTSAPWAPGSATVLIGNNPALNDSSTCMCSYGGTIQIVFAGQVQTMVP